MAQEPFNIRLGTDLSELVTLRPDRTMTTWDPAFNWHGEAFWCCGTDDLDQTAYVIAARLFDVEDLEAELESGVIFHPQGYLGECNVVVDIPRIKGCVAHTGNLWVAPESRGRGLAVFANQLLHAEALLRWPEAEWFFGLVEKGLADKGHWKAQGYAHCEGRVIWKNTPYGQDFDMKVVYGSRAEIVAGLRQGFSR